MSKILILSCLCLVILYINYTDAQVRPRNPAPPAKRPYKKPPARVLNRVQPATRTRQQQMQIKLRKKTPPVHGRIKPAVVRAYQDDLCLTDPDKEFFHEKCDMFWYCDENFELQEWWCPEETPIFDYYLSTCMSLDEEPMCWEWIDDGNWEAECPENPYDIAFLPGDTCEDYYICLSGQPAQLFCAPGQHWSIYTEYCDTPANAQCDPSIVPLPPALPDCQNISGTIPHPYDCRQFIFCQRNGSRIVQQCPHLHAYDIDSNQCVIEFQAKCGTAFSKRS